MSSPLVPQSVGDVLDRVTILALKAERLPAETARAGARAERKVLLEALTAAGVALEALETEHALLMAANGHLWALEEDMRRFLADGDDATIAATSRAIVAGNAERAAVKRAINEKAGSELTEFKDYATGKR